MITAQKIYDDLKPIVDALEANDQFSVFEKFEVGQKGKEFNFRASGDYSMIECFQLWFKVNVYLKAMTQKAKFKIEIGTIENKPGEALIGVKITFP